MKLTLKNIKELKQNTSSALEKRACRYVIDEWSSYSDKKGIFTDVLNYGCVSGMVGFLIYYSDTIPFYKKHQDEINEMLHEFILDNLFGVIFRSLHKFKILCVIASSNFIINTVIYLSYFIF